MIHDCTDGDMRDLLPDHVHGTLSAAMRSAVAAHLERCAECTAEVELIAAASRAFPAPSIDVDRIVRALPARVRVARRGTSARGAWRVAAAIGVIAIGAFSVVALRERFGAAQRQTASVPRAAETARQAVATPEPVPAVVGSPMRASSPSGSARPRGPGLSFGGGLSDLTDDQLGTLLGELDALDPLPSAEPDAHLTPIMPPADGGHNAR
jgi:anti-sigma factor RsiW